jgi:hypothetical protein
VGGQHDVPADLPPRKIRYPLYRRLGGPQGLSERVGKISPPTSGVPRSFFVRGRGGSTNSVKDRGKRERGSGDGSPLVRGSAQFTNE